MTGKEKPTKYTFEETNTKFKLNWWPTSNTISLQGKTEEVEVIERKIDLIISGTGEIIAENENEEDRVGHDDNLSCETTQRHEKTLQRHNPLMITRSRLKLQQKMQLKENLFRKK